MGLVHSFGLFGKGFKLYYAKYWSEKTPKMHGCMVRRIDHKHYTVPVIEMMLKKA